jgi:hypothetical protein
LKPHNWSNSDRGSYKRQDTRCSALSSLTFRDPRNSQRPILLRFPFDINRLAIGRLGCDRLQRKGRCRFFCVRRDREPDRRGAPKNLLIFFSPLKPFAVRSRANLRSAWRAPSFPGRVIFWDLSLCRTNARICGGPPRKE